MEEQKKSAEINLRAGGEAGEGFFFSVSRPELIRDPSKLNT